jgi:hypothetical protein
MTNRRPLKSPRRQLNLKLQVRSGSLDTEEVRIDVLLSILPHGISELLSMAHESIFSYESVPHYERLLRAEPIYNAKSILHA